VFSRLAEIPPYSEDEENSMPPAVAALKAAVAGADAVLIATPEYNGSVPGQLKNALDWISRPPAASPLRGKPVAVIGASTGLFGAVWAQAELRKVLKTIGARVVELELAVAQAHDTLGDDGLPREAAVREQLRGVLGELAEAAQPLPLAA
jgi:chromate reductase